MSVLFDLVFKYEKEPELYKLLFKIFIKFLLNFSFVDLNIFISLSEYLYFFIGEIAFLLFSMPWPSEF